MELGSVYMYNSLECPDPKYCLFMHLKPTANELQQILLIFPKYVESVILNLTDNIVFHYLELLELLDMLQLTRKCIHI